MTLFMFSTVADYNAIYNALTAFAAYSVGVLTTTDYNSEFG